MHNIKLTVAYDGTDFSGWQRQPGQPTIQGTLEGVVRQLTQQRVILYAAGRTDAGVHAWGQVVNFKTPSELTPEEFKRGCNALLPPSIRIRAAEEVEPDFHARWMAQAKTYVYSIYRGGVVPPFRWRYVLHVRQELDFAAMAEAARYFEGLRDFTSFAASTGSEDEDRERTMVRSIFCSQLIDWSEERRRGGLDLRLAALSRGVGLCRPRLIFFAIHGKENCRHAFGSRPRPAACERHSAAD